MLCASHYPGGGAVLDSHIYLAKTSKAQAQWTSSCEGLETDRECKIGGVESIELTFGIGTSLPQNCIYVQEAEGDIEYREMKNDGDW